MPDTLHCLTEWLGTPGRPSSEAGKVGEASGWYAWRGRIWRGFAAAAVGGRQAERGGIGNAPSNT